MRPEREQEAAAVPYRLKDKAQAVYLTPGPGSPSSEGALGVKAAA